jgi:hypothetical protein
MDSRPNWNHSTAVSSHTLPCSPFTNHPVTGRLSLLEPITNRLVRQFTISCKKFYLGCTDAMTCSITLNQGSWESFQISVHKSDATPYMESVNIPKLGSIRILWGPRRYTFTFFLDMFSFRSVNFSTVASEEKYRTRTKIPETMRKNCGVWMKWTGHIRNEPALICIWIECDDPCGRSFNHMLLDYILGRFLTECNLVWDIHLVYICLCLHRDNRNEFW